MDNQLHPELAREIGQPMDVKKYDVHPSLAAEVQEEQPNPELQPQEQQNNLQLQPQQVQQAVQENPRERDWREVRKRAEEARHLEREKQQLERELAFYRDQTNRQQMPSDDYRTDTERHLMQEMDNLKREIANQKRESALALEKATVMKAELRLAEDFPDIKQVVTDENVKRLEYEYPHLYNAVISSNDVYAVGAAAYEMIIAKGIYKKPMNALNQITNQVISRNQSKPKSASHVSPQTGDTPIQSAHSFMGNSVSTEDERKALYAEMVAASRNKY
jgi:hypothetical protein